MRPSLKMTRGETLVQFSVHSYVWFLSVSVHLWTCLFICLSLACLLVCLFDHWISTLASWKLLHQK